MVSGAPVVVAVCGVLVLVLVLVWEEARKWPETGAGGHWPDDSLYELSTVPGNN